MLTAPQSVLVGAAQPESESFRELTFVGGGLLISRELSVHSSQAGLMRRSVRSSKKTVEGLDEYALTATGGQLSFSPRGISLSAIWEGVSVP